MQGRTMVLGLIVVLNLTITEQVQSEEYGSGGARSGEEPSSIVAITYVGATFGAYVSVGTNKLRSVAIGEEIGGLRLGGINDSQGAWSITVLAGSNLVTLPSEGCWEVTPSTGLRRRVTATNEPSEGRVVIDSRGASRIYWLVVNGELLRLEERTGKRKRYDAGPEISLESWGEGESAIAVDGTRTVLVNGVTQVFRRDGAVWVLLRKWGQPACIHAQGVLSTR